MLLQFLNRLRRVPAPAAENLQLGARSVPLLLVRNARARRYVLRLKADGAARVTIPRGGSLEEARAFVERNRVWLERQLERRQTRPQPPIAWSIGSEIWFRGEQMRIENHAPGQIIFGGEIVAVKDAATDLGGMIWAKAGGASVLASRTPPDQAAREDARPTKLCQAVDLRPPIERYLRQLAARELPPRVGELARKNNFSVQRISVRNQKSRWGSCSRRGTISLNWRLIQTPEFVRDYIILHELAHLRHMNHSERFWAEVERLCPNYRTAERWLKTHRDFLR